MAKASNRPEQKQKAAKFSEEQKKKILQAQSGGEKTHLIPDVEWQSNDNLDLRGDVAEAIQNNLMAAYEALQRAGQAFQVMLNMNIQNGKAKLTYSWNNGEKPTDAEINEFKSQMEQLSAMKKAELEKVQGVIAEELKDQPKTNLVTVDGDALTAENLEKSKSIIV